MKSTGPSTATLAISLFLIALCLRLLFLYDFSDNPTFTAPVVDAQTYDVLARDLAAGKPLAEELFWQPLFYPLWLSSVYRISDSSILLAKVFQAILGSATCLLTFLLALHFLDRRSAILAGLITAFYGPLLFFESQLVATGWAAFWSVLLLLLFVIAERQRNLRAFALLGACGALSILTRPTFLPFFIAACLVLFLGLAREKMAPSRQLTRFSVLLLGCALFLLPVALFNQQLTGRLGILPSSGGINLFIGNNLQREETLTARPGAQWQAIVHLPAQAGEWGNIWKQQEYFLARVRDYALTAPADFAKGLGQKTLQLLSGRETPRNVDLYELSQWSTLLRFLTWKISGFGFPFGVLLPLAMIGLGSQWRKYPAPVILFPFLYGASLVLVFVTARYRTPMIPVLSIFAASGVFAISDVIQNKRWRAAAWIGTSALAIVLAACLPGPFAEERQSYYGEMYREAALYKIRQNQLPEARALFLKSIEEDPSSSEAHSGLAQTFYRQGRVREAKAEWERAVALNPDWFEAVNNLAWLLSTTAQTELRDPERATQLAKHACELRAYKDAGALDTLAAAQANQGQFPAALASLEQAISLIDPTRQGDLLQELQRRQALYLRQESYVE